VVVLEILAKVLEPAAELLGFGVTLPGARLREPGLQGLQLLGALTRVKGTP
jgi:hypothetical protein